MTPPEGRKKILLVDDIAAFLELERSFFANEEVDVLTASDGPEALRLVREERPQLVLVDEVMPGMMGHEVCAAVKADESLRDIAVVIVTASAGAASIDACMASGCDDYMVKPVKKSVVLRVAEKFLNTRRRRVLRMLVKAVHVEPALGASPDHFFGYTVDISDRGMLVETDEPLRPEERLDLQFFLPGQSEKIAARGRVARILERAEGDEIEGRAVGVEFAQISDRGRERIEQYVKRLDRSTRLLTP